MGAGNTDPFEGLLADTWWFGLTSRMTPNQFKELASLRQNQGFNAVQLVVGIPPEVGPLNDNARSDAGFPWSINGDINTDYLALARKRVELLNATGLKVIIYGAWGHQIAWIGRERMAEWWSRVVKALDDLDVIYCLTGESNLLIGRESSYLPDRTSANPTQSWLFNRLPGRVKANLRPIYKRLVSKPSTLLAERRQADWSYVLSRLNSITSRPLIIHPLPGETGAGVVDNGNLLAANTIQTGHSASTRNDLWQIPLMEGKKQPARPFLNLEPWYEGILGNFGPDDQLFAYWVTMLAGASGYCYGAHGIWNVGDGRFLAHWGSQTFAEAMALQTPYLIGESHKLRHLWREYDSPTVESQGEALTFIGRRGVAGEIRFYPDADNNVHLPPGRYWLPLSGSFTNIPPHSGPVVVLSNEA